MKEKPMYSVIVPVFNSQKSLEELYARLKTVFEGIDKAHELIFVNDCSHDDSFLALKKLKKKDPKITVIDLFRNFGQQNALMCGFHYCSGEYIITLDDDLQNPPEEIPKLIEKIDEGYDAVFASYRRKKDKFYKNLGSLMMRKLTQKIFNLRNNLRFSSFRIIKRKIVEEIKAMNTPFPYISGMTLRVTRNIANIEVEHHPRYYGRSNYTLKKLVKVAFNLLINYSTLPLKLISIGGLIISALALSIGVFVFIRKLMVETARTGWTSTVMLISFFSAMFFIIAIIFGEYLKRILAEVENRKQYVVKTVYQTDTENSVNNESYL